MNPAAAQYVTTLDYAVIVAYFVVVVTFGAWFATYTKSTKDFFLGGQRFAWWLIAFSSTATTVGSYSFVKYSEVAYEYGLSSTQSYLNDWFWIAILVFVWLPIIYFSRIQSVPEYFERRFGTRNRLAATALILVYLVGYVGVNLYTMGVLLQTLLGWSVWGGAAATAAVVMVYMFAGGQTSVIMTDLLQGVILLVAGLGLFFAGVYHVGGFGDFWALLPRTHKFGFSEFAAPDDFSFIGVYVQDGLANSGAFMLMNQGMIMRFLSLKSAEDARKTALCWTLILMPLAAIAVSGGGWVARAMVESGDIETTPQDAFVDAARFLCIPGVFGFVLAALTAALMSTADTLVTAVSSIFLNDIYRPYVAPNRADKHYLAVARLSSTVTVLIGFALVFVFMRQESIYKAHALFTAAVTPPIVVAILLGVLWKRFTPAASLATLVGGSALIALSFPLGATLDLSVPLLGPFSFGMGPDSYSFTRALYGLAVCTGLGIAVSLFTQPRKLEEIRGLVTGTQLDAMRAFKGGSVINRKPGKKARALLTVDAALEGDQAIVSPDVMEIMGAGASDLIYAADCRWWFGGLRSAHLHVHAVDDGKTLPMNLRISPIAAEHAHLRDGQVVLVEKIL